MCHFATSLLTSPAYVSLFLTLLFLLVELKNNFQISVNLSKFCSVLSFDRFSLWIIAHLLATCSIRVMALAFCQSVPVLYPLEVLKISNYILMKICKLSD